ncbi:MAG: hypothetical protein O2857_18005, partial [Planctomycetota bacterium]|nr:hypothetical protein [Planctomycetota bacterium]
HRWSYVSPYKVVMRKISAVEVVCRVGFPDCGLTSKSPISAISGVTDFFASERQTLNGNSKITYGPRRVTLSEILRSGNFCVADAAPPLF